MNRRGQYIEPTPSGPNWMTMFTLVILIIVAMIILFFIGLVGPHIADIMSTMKTTVDTLPADTSDYNVTGKLQMIASPMLAVGTFLEWLSYAVVIGMIILIIAMAAAVRTYPIMILPYIIIMGVVIVLSIFLSAGYEQITLQNQTYSAWEGTAFLLQNLPWIMTAIGFIGGIAMFVLINTRPEGAV